jgi:hypothetical protein
MVGSCANCGLQGVQNYKWAQVDNIKRDPFETAVGLFDQGTMFGMGGAIAAPVTAYIYDWNILPIGQVLWLKELESYATYPPMQTRRATTCPKSSSRLRSKRTSVTRASRCW